MYIIFLKLHILTTCLIGLSAAHRVETVTRSGGAANEDPQDEEYTRRASRWACRSLVPIRLEGE